MKYSIIIPAHNEENSIESTIRDIYNTLAIDYEIVVVNDHSTDDTKDKVKQLQDKYSNILLVDNLNPACFGNALKTGFKAARGDFVVAVMADSCDEVTAISRMATKAEEGYDLICGSRYMSGGKKIGGPALKTFFSRCFGFTLNFLIGIPTKDVANAFKMYRKKMLENIRIESDWFEISPEITIKAFFNNYSITEVPTLWLDRKEGKSKFNMKKVGSAYFRLFFWAVSTSFASKIKKVFKK